MAFKIDLNMFEYARLVRKLLPHQWQRDCEIRPLEEGSSLYVVSYDAANWAVLTLADSGSAWSEHRAQNYATPEDALVALFTAVPPPGATQ